jgi:hypothetical protein
MKEKWHWPGAMCDNFCVTLMLRQPFLQQWLPLIWTRNVSWKAWRDEADPQREQIMNILYPPNCLHLKDLSPTGCYHPNAMRALWEIITNRTVHETIKQAWLLCKWHVHKVCEAEMQCKFDSMCHAMNELKHSFPHLAKEVSQKPGPLKCTEEEMKLASTLKGFVRRAIDLRLPDLFPREMRPLMDTPPIRGWNNLWRQLTSTRNK